MIRFCDKEICCVSEKEMNWQQMLDYFLDWHMDEKIYILDEMGRFVGSVIYNSLFGMKPKNAAVTEYRSVDNDKSIWVAKDYVILDEDIWDNGRKFFRVYPYGLLPVLDKKHQLVCFAWNDEEANRELRMLDELMGIDSTAGFQDIYPEIDSVMIHGCNELAYYFVRYLERINIPVDVTGEFWSKTGILKKAGGGILDYRSYSVFAEGCTEVQEEVGFRKSVSSEFECIDRIYEENILRGIIRDANGSFWDILQCIKHKQIVLLGAGNESLDAYDFLLGFGVDIYCFSSEDEADKGKKLFGKRVLSRVEIIESVKNPVFVEIQSRYSAWGFGGVDFYHYMGYKRNEQFFLLCDYVEIPKNGFVHILNLKSIDRKIVLAGDYWLCLKLKQMLKVRCEKLYERIVFCDVLQEYENQKEGLKRIVKNEICINDICLLLIPSYVGYYDNKEQNHSYRETVRRKYLLAILEVISVDVVDYPIDNLLFFGEIKNYSQQHIHSDLKVKKIILGSIEDHNGNAFFRGLLDNHPQILMMGYNFINENLYSICIRLEMEHKDNILSLLWKFYYEEKEKSAQDEWPETIINKFNHSMEELLSVNDTFTSQELFVMIHISYAKAWEMKIGNISDMIIYWEPHNMKRENLEDYAVWLGKSGISGQIVNVVRNALMQKGSRLKGLEEKGWFPEINKKAFYCTLANLNIRRKEYDGWGRLTVRFEDLKCNPDKELTRICDEWEIEWSDTLLETTIHGQKDFYDNITGFNLAPVFRTYEEYYSEFDRFRIMVITSPFQKKYGYSYVSCLTFNRRELQKLFEKNFRFEKFLGERANMYDAVIQRFIADNLWSVRRDEVMGKYKESEMQDKNSG